MEKSRTKNLEDTDRTSDSYKAGLEFYKQNPHGEPKDVDKFVPEGVPNAVWWMTGWIDGWILRRHQDLFNRFGVKWP